MHIYTLVYTYISIYIHVHNYIYICMHSYTHIYISIHIYTYIHICIPHTHPCMAAHCHAGSATNLAATYQYDIHSTTHPRHYTHSTHDLHTLHIAKHTLHPLQAYKYHILTFRLQGRARTGQGTHI